jgi:hypothetical protein
MPLTHGGEGAVRVQGGGSKTTLNQQYVYATQITTPRR